MKKKYSIRKRRKTIGTIPIIVTVVILLFTISVGYSLFSSQLKLIGNVHIEKEGPDLDLPTEISDSDVTWKISATPWGETQVSYYMVITITNNDEDYKSWSFSIDFPPYVIEDKISAWEASSVTVKRVGDYDRVTMEITGWNGEFSKGQKKSSEFIIALNSTDDLVLNNFVFNNKLVKNFTKE